MRMFEEQTIAGRRPTGAIGFAEPGYALSEPQPGCQWQIVTWNEETFTASNTGVPEMLEAAQRLKALVVRPRQ